MSKSASSGDLSEKRTRTDLIDKELRNAGWISKYIKEEVNSIKSDFNAKVYVLSENKDDTSGRFIDYLLLAEDNSTIAFIEAKKFSKSEDVGRSQSRTYLADIRKQTKENVPYFLTNGHKWLFVDQDGIERQISGPFSQADLSRRNELHRNRTNPTRINTSHIVDRPRNIIIVKQLLEHIQKGHRLGLISMATGTGKTRVAMGIIDALMKSNYVRNVLFAADRIALASQAESAGFKEFFTAPVVDLRENPQSFPDGLYVTTLQTLKGPKEKRYYKKFSPGFFDLIVFDEAHRSIYDPNREVHRYFDAIKIGLTATPSKSEDKNTFKLFECDGERPTVEYTYDEAITDKILVPYRAVSVDTSVLYSGIEGAKLSNDLKTQLRRQELDPEQTFLPGASYARIFLDDKTNELVVREFLNRCYRSDEGKPAKTIFFCVDVNHAKKIKKAFNRMDPSLSADVQIIVSKFYRYTDEITRLKLDSEPRIAISVGVLDTGIDIPEVCNLVFAKPVFATIRFWQMLGRGTRNQQACEHLEWLPNREKHDFLILDFTIGGHSNIKYHNLKQSKEGKAGTDVLTKIFLNRVELLRKKVDTKQKEIIENKILGDIKALNVDSFIVREKLPVIKKIVTKKFDLKQYMDELKKEIAPLIALNPGDDALVSAFILQVEKLFGYILDGKNDEIFKMREYVEEKMQNILQKDNLDVINEKREVIMKVFQDAFWNDLSFDDVEFIIKELASLMRYYEPNPKKLIQVDAPDTILKVEQFEHAAKEDDELKKFLESNPLVKKIKDGEGLTAHQLLNLIQELNKIRPEITVENIENIQRIDFIIFIRKIIGLSHDYDPKELIEREFDKHIIETNQNYNSEQIRFLHVLKKVFARTKRLELTDFTIPPLSNERPLDKFPPSELQQIVTQCNRIKMR